MIPVCVCVFVCMHAQAYVCTLYMTFVCTLAECDVTVNRKLATYEAAWE